MLCVGSYPCYIHSDNRSMDSTKIQNALNLIVSRQPAYEKNKEDLRSIKFKDSPILVLGTLFEDPRRESTHPLVWCNNKDKNYQRCTFCRRMLDNTLGYYPCKDFDQIYSICFHKECIKPVTNNPYHPKHSLQVLVFVFVTPNKICYCCNRHQ